MSQVKLLNDSNDSTHEVGYITLFATLPEINDAIPNSMGRRPFTKGPLTYSLVPAEKSLSENSWRNVRLMFWEKLCCECVFEVWLTLVNWNLCWNRLCLLVLPMWHNDITLVTTDWCFLFTSINSTKELRNVYIYS